MRRHTSTLSLLATLLLLAAPAPASQKMLVHFINVGQGAATLIEFPCGAMLVDTVERKTSCFTARKR
jgi:beta-lactamase superfamily II metal-dependent hydrolase